MSACSVDYSNLPDRLCRLFASDLFIVQYFTINSDLKKFIWTVCPSAGA